MFLELPEDVWRNVALHLGAPDILSFLSTHHRINSSLGGSEVFWNLLINRDAACSASCGDCPKSARRAYMVQAYKGHLPSVKWYPVETLQSYESRVSAREGHLSCVFKGNSGSKICITGGFTDDNTVYMMNVPKSVTSTQRSDNANAASWTWERLHPGQRTSFVYGASLTSLEDVNIESNNPNEMRAIRFGGFKSGGYSHETNEVAVLTIKSEQTENGLRQSACWESVATRNSQFADPRAYHTATLIGGRYLLVIGGMTWRESILKEAMLDTRTWTWFDLSITSASGDKPSGRHGHSVVLDSKRNRLVLFGGGSGTDLLRSGKDNSEVWELKFGNDWESNVQSSLPWTWRKIYSDTTPSTGEEPDGEDAGAADEGVPPWHVSPSEALCLGRCHNCVKVSPDRALLLFGSGRPSTNGMVSYDLSSDKFHRPVVQGPMPTPRFTGTVSLLPDEGYLFAHGGYSSQESDAIDDMTVLDLAPALNREFTGLPIDRRFRDHGAVSDEDALRGRQNQATMLQGMLNSLSSAEEGERQAMAAQMLGHMIASGQMGGRSFMLMNMIANGAAILTRGEEMDDDSENDEDY